MIHITNLTKKFSDVTAINNLSIDFDGGIIGLVGHNGAGKSTLFRLMSDIIIPDEGFIYIDTYPHDSDLTKSRVFFLSDNPYFPKRSFIKDVYSFYSTFYSIDEEKFNTVISKFELPIKRRIDGFSKGMLRQLFIALAISIDVDYYFLDEAFDGLDPLVINKIKTYLLELKDKNKTIIISSHNISTLEKLVDQFVVLNNGTLATQGDEEMMSKTFVKYQLMSDVPVDENKLKSIGLKVVSLQKVGSIYHLVIVKNEYAEKLLDDTLKPKLLEAIPIDSAELITIEMLYAKQKEN